MERTHLDSSQAATSGPPDGSVRSPANPPGSPAPAVSSPELRNLGKFRFLRRLGEGGMGAVYLAYEDKHSKQFAVKILNDSLAYDQRYIDRFHREARAGAALNHPNIVRTFTSGQDSATGKYYLVLE